jgi:hypothetical protein
MAIHKPSSEPDPMARRPGQDELATQMVEQLTIQKLRVVTIDLPDTKPKKPSPLAGIRPAPRKPNAGERLRAISSKGN